MSTTDEDLKAAIVALHDIGVAASIPPTMRYLDSASAAAMIGYSVPHFLQRIACRADFPVARDLGGNPRWKASEVDAWASAKPPRNLGRRSKIANRPEAA